jgi:hypothetical protein
MAWDSSRPVPWTRLMREWVIYAVFMALVFAVFFSDNILGALTGLLVSGPLYLALGAALAKLGYQRKTIKELRSQRSEPSTSTSSTSSTSTSSRSSAPERARPAPTRRTSTGPSQRPRSGSKRRR